MNKCILIGRLTRDPEIRYANGNSEPLAIAHYTLAVDRRQGNEQKKADFLNMVAFGKAAEFVEKYLRKGVKISVVASAQSGSYTNKEGNKVYYTEFVVHEHEFVEGKKDSAVPPQIPEDEDGFMNIPEGVDELPFNS